MKHFLHLLQNIKNSRYRLTLTILLLLILLLNAAACSKAFCDFYTDHIYSRISDFLGRLSNPVPFAIGEILMITGGAYLLSAILLSLLLMPLKDKQSFSRFTKTYLKILSTAAAIVLFLYTTLWGIPFRSSLLGETGHYEKQYTTEELRKLWLFVIENLNESCNQVSRDKNGLILYDTKENTEKSVTEAMKKISDKYTRLKGFYPTMKPALCSDVLKWMQIGGYTYPYTMEITYDKYTTDLYFPTLYAHESAHHQGYYQENEANFLSFLSCANSGNPVLKYSAYHEIYYYLDDAYAAVIASSKNPSLIREYKTTTVSNQVWLDEKEERRKVEKMYSAGSHPLENYKSFAEDTAEIGWDTQGKFLSENSYNGVVQLLLEYYDGILY